MDTDEEAELEGTNSSDEGNGSLGEDSSQDGEDGEDESDAKIDKSSSSQVRHSDPRSANKELIKDESRLPAELRQDLALLKDWKPLSRYAENTEAEFWTFMDREKSKGWNPAF